MKYALILALTTCVAAPATAQDTRTDLRAAAFEMCIAVTGAMEAAIDGGLSRELAERVADANGANDNPILSDIVRKSFDIAYDESRTPQERVEQVMINCLDDMDDHIEGAM